MPDVLWSLSIDPENALSRIYCRVGGLRSPYLAYRDCLKKAEEKNRSVLHFVKIKHPQLWSKHLPLPCYNSIIYDRFLRLTRLAASEANMTGLNEVLGMFACLLPILALVAYMAWATRRRQCPHCHHAISPGESTCAHCGNPLDEEKQE